MQYIDVQGRRISQLIMGSDSFTPDDSERVRTMLDTYLELGGNTIDTARIYRGGQSESAIGQWLQAGAHRAEVNLLTKGAHHDARGPRVTPQAIADDLAASLDQLRTDYIDLYALHRDDPAVSVGPIIEALNHAVEQGRIRVLGASNWTTARIAEANRYAADHGLQGFAFSSPNFSLATAKEPFWPGCVVAEEATISWHRKTGLPLLSWSAQGRGFFTGRYGPEDRTNPDLVRVFYSEANWARYRRAEQLAADKGVATIQIALAYVLSQSFPTGAIVGPETPAELRSCRQAADIRLTAREVKWLENGRGDRSELPGPGDEDYL